jgi:hypothetical protein
VRKERGATAAEAIQHFEAVLALRAAGGVLLPVQHDPVTTEEMSTGEQNDHVLDGIGTATLALGDADAEHVFASAPPGDEKTLAAWLRASTEALTAAAERYLALVSDDSLAFDHGEYAIAALAQSGRVYARFADSIYEAPVPEKLRQGEYAEDTTLAYCDAMAEQAEPIAAKAIEAWNACVSKAAELEVTGRWPDRCQQELNARRPPAAP